MYDNMPFLYYEEETSACLLCGEEIDYDKTLCRDCWEKAREDFENAFKRPPKGRDIKKYYDKALKEGLHNKKADIEEIEDELAMLAVGYYYTAEFPENGKELLNRITDDFEELERKTGKTTRGSTVDERSNLKKISGNTPLRGWALCTFSRRTTDRQLALSPRILTRVRSQTPQRRSGISSGFLP